LYASTSSVWPGALWALGGSGAIQKKKKINKGKRRKVRHKKETQGSTTAHYPVESVGLTGARVRAARGNLLRTNSPRTAPSQTLRQQPPRPAEARRVESASAPREVHGEATAAPPPAPLADGWSRRWLCPRPPRPLTQPRPRHPPQRQPPPRPQCHLGPRQSPRLRASGKRQRRSSLADQRQGRCAERWPLRDGPPSSCQPSRATGSESMPFKNKKT
jgi:hypothetical protein